MLQNMTLGAILDRSIEILKKYFKLILCVGLIFSLFNMLTQWLSMAFQLGFFSKWIDENMLLIFLGGFFYFMIMMAVSYLNSAMIIKIIQWDHEEKTLEFSKLLLASFSYIWPLLIASFALTLIIFLGFVLLIIPGIIFMTAYAFTSQVIVIENVSAMASLRRSWDLTKGFRWKILSIFLIGFIIAFLIGIPSGILQVALPSIDVGVNFMDALKGNITPETLEIMKNMEPRLNTVNFVVNSLVGLITNTLATVSMSTIMTVTYMHLRNVKEGVDLITASAGNSES
jgi:hypothetical protein